MTAGARSAAALGAVLCVALLAASCCAAHAHDTRGASPAAPRRLLQDAPRPASASLDGGGGGDEPTDDDALFTANGAGTAGTAKRRLTGSVVRPRSCRLVVDSSYEYFVRVLWCGCLVKSALSRDIKLSI
jgi:hypothetical protein